MDNLGYKQEESSHVNETSVYPNLSSGHSRNGGGQRKEVPDEKTTKKPDKKKKPAGPIKKAYKRTKS